MWRCSSCNIAIYRYYQYFLPKKVPSSLFPASSCMHAAYNFPRWALNLWRKGDETTIHVYIYKIYSCFQNHLLYFWAYMYWHSQVNSQFSSFIVAASWQAVGQSIGSQNGSRNTVTRPMRTAFGTVMVDISGEVVTRFWHEWDLVHCSLTSSRVLTGWPTNCGHVNCICINYMHADNVCMFCNFFQLLFSH